MKSRGKKNKAKPIAKPSLDDVDNLDGHSFEFFCADMIKKLGYNNVQVTKASGDNGVDILASLNGCSYAIQCKRYSKKVGVKAVQEVFSGSKYYNCQKAIVITTNYYTDQAIETARKLGVILWDRDFLKKMLRAAYTDSESAKKAIINSNYQAQSTKSSNIDVGCGIAIMIAITLLAIGLVFYLCMK
jgi:restriction system protein